VVLFPKKMRYAVLADIHSNITALKTVLKDIERHGGVDEIWCLGDIVGYGPDPRQCLEILRRQRHIAVAGNHDLAAAGKLALTSFNPDGAAAIDWTVSRLTSEDIGFLAALPTVIEKDDFTLVHGSPRDPVWEYLHSISNVRENFVYFKTSYCLVGHCHLPQIFKHDTGTDCTFIPFTTGIGQVLSKSRLIINPGSVGQPRDGDPRASYAIYDSEAAVIRLFRVPYCIEDTQRRIMQYNLPVRLAIRLGNGL
jgi:predicted phosphodiesterase